MDVAVVETAGVPLQASKGAAVISGQARTQGFLSAKGYFSPQQWDVYWAHRQVRGVSAIEDQELVVADMSLREEREAVHAQACLRALPHTRPGQRVSCVPGSTALSHKGRLIETLQAAYGSGAFSIIPRTFLLPQQYWDWRLWLTDSVTILSSTSLCCFSHIVAHLNCLLVACAP